MPVVRGLGEKGQSSWDILDCMDSKDPWGSQKPTQRPPAPSVRRVNFYQYLVLSLSLSPATHLNYISQFPLQLAGGMS